MGADTDHDQPFRLLDPVFVRLWVFQVGIVVRAGRRDLVGAAVADENRLAAPFHGNALAFLDRAEIDFDAGQRQHIGRRIHAVDQGPCESRRASRADAQGRQIQKLAPARAFVVRFRRLNLVRHASILVNGHMAREMPAGSKKIFRGVTV